VSCKPGFLLPVRVLSKLFQRLFLEKLNAAHKAGKLDFYGRHKHLADSKAFAVFLAPLWKKKWYVNTKPPFAGPKQVLAYLSRYTHRVAISNSRLIKVDENGVTFRFKDYRIKGRKRYKTMTLDCHEFIRRFLIHVLPKGQHRIRHYGLFANGNRAENLAKMRELLNVPEPDNDGNNNEADNDGSVAPDELACPCPKCGGRMFIIETFEAGCEPRHMTRPEGIDSS